MIHVTVTYATDYPEIFRIPSGNLDAKLFIVNCKRRVILCEFLKWRVLKLNPDLPFVLGYLTE